MQVVGNSRRRTRAGSGALFRPDGAVFQRWDCKWPSRLIGVNDLALSCPNGRATPHSNTQPLIEPLGPDITALATGTNRALPASDT